jgi:ubiquinone biosynthesis accessory factor UbiJ
MGAWAGWWRVCKPCNKFLIPLIGRSPFSAQTHAPRMETMATSSPFFMPPTWLVDESRRRIVLLLNHVLMQEPEATKRLVRHKSQSVQMKWRELDLHLLITPAGLFDLALPSMKPDLLLEVLPQSPLELVQSLFQGKKPDVRVEGDVQLAAEINWLADHVRWDVEEDLSRIVGDVPARMMTQFAQQVREAINRLARVGPGKPADTGNHAS